jgi:glycosyltransferase involved in cell wall biosynthesis
MDDPLLHAKGMRVSTFTAQPTFSGVLSLSLDVIVPTFNRSALLTRMLRSLANAQVPKGMAVRVYVVDNNSTDDTADRVKTFTGALPLYYLHESRQGKSRALNTGLQASNGDVVGLIDDDEEIDPDWFREVHRQFSRGGIDFLGGPCFPVWQSPPPAWLPRRYYGLIGCITEPSNECAYGPSFPGMLMGGNAIISRAALERVGPYSEDPSIMRSGSNVCSGEDREMYDRLISSGAKGRFSPSLIVHHHIPSSRLTMAYLRRRLFAHGVSRHFLEARNGVPPCATLFGVPYWYFSRAFSGLPSLLARCLAGRSASSVEAELNWCELAGQLSAAMRSLRH